MAMMLLLATGSCCTVLCCAVLRGRGSSLSAVRAQSQCGMGEGRRGSAKTYQALRY